jgi:hypothetical protein
VEQGLGSFRQQPEESVGEAVALFCCREVSNQVVFGRVADYRDMRAGGPQWIIRKR